MGLADLDELEGWHVENDAARVHYRGATEQYSVEFYDRTDVVLYWAVDGDDDTAVPVTRRVVPDPLRERIREDLGAAGLDPEVERRTL